MTPWLLTLGVGGNLAALAVNLVILREARRDLDAVIAAGIGNGRREIALASVRQEFARLAVIALLILSGAAAAVEIATSHLAEPSFLSLVWRLAYGASGAGLAVDGVLAFRARKRLLDEHRMHYAEHLSARRDQEDRP